MKRKLKGKEKVLAERSLDFLSKYGVNGIQMGSKRIKKDGKDVVEEEIKKKSKKDK